MRRCFRLFYILSLLVIILFYQCSKKPDRETERSNKMKISKSIFGNTKSGENIYLFTLCNNNGMEVRITNYGGIVTSLMIPDKNNKRDDIVLGFDTFQEYLSDHPYFGAIVGRYGNRIAKGQFTLNNEKYQLATNNGENHLHGGIKGFDKVTWDFREISQDHQVGVELKYLSKDGEEGYPGNLSVSVTYTLNDKNELGIKYSAETDKATPVNLTHHSYFNLNGAGSGDILDHQLTIYADRFTPVNDELIPTGELKSVKNSAMDFTTSHTIGARIKEVKGGYDHNYILNNWDKSLRLAAQVVEPVSGRKMEVLTTEPGIQLYTGNFLDGTITGKKRKKYHQHYGFCLETQHFPDSPNQPSFPSTIIKPGDRYSHSTVYRFKW
jgi:aldose 1-epimerase